MFKPFKKGNITSGSGNMGFGSGLISLSGVKNFISNNTRRKKSAPEPEIKKNINRNEDEEIDFNDHYASKISFGNSQTNLTPLNTYTIFINDSCTIEVTATRQGSIVQNVLKLALDKIKANENPNEYCLVEHIEQEKTILKQDSINSINNTRSMYPSSMQKKLSVVKTTRILEPNENLFLLTHVWNQLKSEGKDGFKNVKIILTKTVSKPDFYKPKRASLLKHRFSLQPKPSSGFTLIEALKQTNISIKSDFITKVPSPLLNNTQAVLSINNKTLTINRKRTKSSLNRLVRQKSFDESSEMIDQQAPAVKQYLKITSRSNLDENIYPKQYEMVKEKSEEHLTSTFKSNRTTATTMTKHTMLTNSTDEEDQNDIYETFRDKNTKNCSLTSSNKSTDNTAEMNSHKEDDLKIIKKTLTDYSNDNDEYDDLNTFDYHDDYPRTEEYQFIGQAPLASQSILSSNDLCDTTTTTTDFDRKDVDSQQDIQNQSPLKRLFKSKFK